MSLNSENFKLIALSIFIFFLMLYLVNVNSVKVYRFYRPGCPWCINSKEEWDKFKSFCMFKLIKPVDINLDEPSNCEEKIIDNFGIKSVPTVVAVYTDGRKINYSGERTAEGYLNWVNSNY